MQPTNPAPDPQFTPINTISSQPGDTSIPAKVPEQSQDSLVQAAAGDALPVTQQTAIPTPVQSVSSKSRSWFKKANPEAEAVRQTDQARTSFFSTINIRSWFSNFSIIGYFKGKFAPRVQITANIVLDKVRFKTVISTPYAASSSGTTHDTIVKKIQNLDASLVAQTKDKSGRITGGVIASGDGYGRSIKGTEPQGNKAIADVAREGCKFLEKQMTQVNNSEELTDQSLRQMMHGANSHLQAWNHKHGKSFFAGEPYNEEVVIGREVTNLAVTRVFANEDGTSQVAGVNLGNQRLLAIDARTGETRQLNNTVGTDDCTYKMGVGGRSDQEENYKEDQIETFNMKLQIPPEHLIIITLTDGAWHNLDKGVDVAEQPNPYIIDCAKLQSVIANSQEPPIKPLTSQAVVERLTQHVSQRSNHFREQHFNTLPPLMDAHGKESKEISKSLKVDHPGKPQKSETAEKAKTQLENATIALNKCKNHHKPQEDIDAAQRALEEAQKTLKELSFNDRLYLASEKTASSQFAEVLSEMTALLEEIDKEINPQDRLNLDLLTKNVQDLSESQKKAIQGLYIQRQIDTLRPYLETEKTLLAQAMEAQKALDDATITAMSPFAPKNATAPASVPRAAVARAAQVASQQALKTIEGLKAKWNESHPGNIDVITQWRAPGQAQTNSHVLFDSAGKSSPFHLAATMFQSKVPGDFEERLKSALEARQKLNPTDRLYMASQAPIPHPMFLQEMESIEQALQQKVAQGGAEYQSQLKYAQRQIGILKQMIGAYKAYKGG